METLLLIIVIIVAIVLFFRSGLNKTLDELGKASADKAEAYAKEQKKVSEEKIAKIYDEVDEDFIAKVALSKAKSDILSQILDGKENSYEDDGYRKTVLRLADKHSKELAKEYNKNPDGIKLLMEKHIDSENKIK